MHLAYIDESYDDHEYVLGGIVVPAGWPCLALSNHMRMLQREVFGIDDFTANTEFHARLLFNGQKQFQGMSLGERAEIFRQILMNVLIPGEGHVYAICFDRTDR